MRSPPDQGESRQTPRCDLAVGFSDGIYNASRDGEGHGFHAFAMGTFQGPAWLVPVARYDVRYAPDIGRHALHAAASARLFQGVGLDWEHQDHKDWKDRWDPQNLFSYEAVTAWDWSNERKFRPCATSDPVRLGWGLPKVEAVSLTLAPETAAVIAAAPAGGKLTRAGKRTLVEGVVVDCVNGD